MPRRRSGETWDELSARPAEAVPNPALKIRTDYTTRCVQARHFITCHSADWFFSFSGLALVSKGGCVRGTPAGIATAL